MKRYLVGSYSTMVWGTRRYIVMPAPEPGHLTLSIADRHSRVESILDSWSRYCSSSPRRKKKQCIIYIGGILQILS